MKLRTAGQGYYKGRKFWGCSAFPLCRGIRQVEVVAPGTRALFLNPLYERPTPGVTLPRPQTLRAKWGREMDRALVEFKAA